MNNPFYRTSGFRNFIGLILFMVSLTLTACQSTKTVTQSPKTTKKEVKKVKKQPWYETSKVFAEQHDNFEATGTAVSLDSAEAVTKARHTSVAILQSRLQEELENLRTQMVDNGVKQAKEPLFILNTRTCLNQLYDQLSPDKIAVQKSGNGFKAYVQMYMSRSQVWDNWKKSLSGKSDFLEATNGNPVVKAWLNPVVSDSSSAASEK